MEYDANIKGSEKVDALIMCNNINILVEAKKVNCDLKVHLIEK